MVVGSSPTVGVFAGRVSNMVVVGGWSKMDTLGIEPRAFRMQSGCDTTTPCVRQNMEMFYGKQETFQPTLALNNINLSLSNFLTGNSNSLLGPLRGEKKLHIMLANP